RRYPLVPLRLRGRPGQPRAWPGDDRHPRRIRSRSAASGRGRRDVGVADGDPAGDRLDAQAPDRGGAAMSTITAEAGLTVSRAVSGAHRAVRIRRYLETAAQVEA